MNALQKTFSVWQISLKRYKFTDYWRYFLQKWTCFNMFQHVSWQFFFRALWNVIIAFVKVNENLVTKWVLRMITWAKRGYNSFFYCCRGTELKFLTSTFKPLRSVHTRRQIVVTCHGDTLQRQIVLFVLENFCENRCNRILLLQQVAQIQSDLIFCDLLGRQIMLWRQRFS